MWNYLWDNRIKIMWKISWIIVLFIIFILSTQTYIIFSSEKTRIIAFLDSLGVYYFIILLLISIFIVFLPYKNIDSHFERYIRRNQDFFINSFPVIAFFFSTVGYLIFFINLFFLRINFLFLLGKLIFSFGFSFLISSIMIKKFLENRIYFSINETKKLFPIDKDNDRQVKRLIRLIGLTLNNINLKLDKKLKISFELGYPPIETIFSGYLYHYIKLGNKTQLDSLENHIVQMSKFVDETDTISDFKKFSDEFLQLSGNVINFFKNNNLRIISRHSILNFFKDIDNIKNIVIVLFYLVAIASFFININIPDQLFTIFK